MSLQTSQPGNAYVDYEEKLTNVSESDKNHGKLIEYQLQRIEDLVLAEKIQIAVDDLGVLKLEEQNSYSW